MTEVDQASLSCWRSVLSSMRPGNKLYKPAVLLVALDLIDQGHAKPSHVALADVNDRFRKLVGRVRSGSANASEPFIRLSGDGIWVVPEGDRKQDRVASFSPDLARCLDSDDGRSAVRALIYEQLMGFGKDESTHLVTAHRGS